MFFVRRCIYLVKSSNFSVAERHFRSVYDPKEIYENPIMKDDQSKPVPTKPKSEAGTFNGYIPLEKVDISYCLSSGPGGQHVNKIQTCAEIRFELVTADWIPQEVRSLMMTKFDYRINKEGYFYVKSDRTRSRNLNLADCLDKIRYTVREIEDEIKTQNKTATKEDLQILENKRLKGERRRLQDKRMNSEKKRIVDDIV